jgi:hypothetical protein
MLGLFNKLKLGNSVLKFVNLSSVFKNGENTFYLIATNVFQTSVSLIFIFLLAREYGSSQFEVHSFVLSIILLISISPFFGSKSICRREFVEFPENKVGIFGTYGLVNFVSSFVCFLYRKTFKLGLKIMNL